ncbi:MAG: GtrA family protein [Gammaproteobacteria bacterium]
MSKFREFLRYSTAGVISTLIDWVIFFYLAIHCGVNYQIALMIALSLSSIVNYKINRDFTFQNASPKILRQFTSYYMLVLASLAMSLALMHYFVDILLLQKMTARVLTTGGLAIANYIMTKLIPFNERFFRQAD